MLILQRKPADFLPNGKLDGISNQKLYFYLYESFKFRSRNEWETPVVAAAAAATVAETVATMAALTGVGQRQPASASVSQ